MNKLAEVEGRGLAADLKTEGRSWYRAVSFPRADRTAMFDLWANWGGGISGAATLLCVQFGAPRWGLIPVLGWLVTNASLAATHARHRDVRQIDSNSKGARVFSDREASPLHLSRAFCEIHPDLPR